MKKWIICSKEKAVDVRGFAGEAKNKVERDLDKLEVTETNVSKNNFEYSGI